MTTLFTYIYSSIAPLLFRLTTNTKDARVTIMQLEEEEKEQHEQ